MKMCKDILKIIRIYLKQYSIMLIILLIAFSTFAATTTNKQLNELKNGIAVYDFQLTTGIAKELEIRKDASNDELNKKTHELYKLKEEYQKNYKEKLSKEKLDEIADYYIKELYNQKYARTLYYSSYEIHPLDENNGKWIIFFIYVTKEHQGDKNYWDEVVFMLPDGTIVISENNFEEIKFE